MHFDQLRRRDFITLVGGAAVGWPRTGHAQQPGKVYHIGYLSALFPPSEPDWQQRSPFLQGMRELGMRVVFQMSVADSSNLIDSPLASKLGVHRALFANEETGTLEKFRPYGLPSEAWLERVRQQLARPAGVRG